MQEPVEGQLPETSRSEAPIEVHQPIETKSSQRSRWRFLWIVLAFGATADWLLGTLVRLTVRDAGTWFTPVFYASPIPVLVVTGCVASEAFRKLGWKKRARFTLVLMFLQLLSWLPDAFHFRAETPPSTAMRMVFWNVSRGAGGYPQLAEEMLSYDPDLICLVESSGSGQLVETWLPHLPGFKVYRLGSGMMVMVRGEIYGVEPGMIHEVARYRNMHVKIHDKTFGLCLIDIRSDPLLPRTQAFERLPTILESFLKTPKLLAGDFNTPSDSELFARLRPEMSNAFEAKG